MKTDFATTTWKPCRETVVNDRAGGGRGGRVGGERGGGLGAKSRALRRLREELDGLLD